MNHLVEYIVIACYLLFMAAMGLAFRRFNGDVSDYFRSGSRATWWLVGSSIFMSAFSAYTFTGAAGVAFEAGWSVTAIYLGNALGLLFNFFFLAAWFRQLRAITVPEVIRLRFGVVTQQCYAVLGVLTNLLSSGLSLWAVAIFSSSIFGYSVNTVIIVLGLVVLAYSLAGGSWAVMATDVVQGMILIPMTVLITFLCLRAVGGLEGFFSLVAERGLRSEFKMVKPSGAYPGESFTWWWMAAMFIKQVWEFNSLGSSVRYFSVKDGRAARKAALLAFLLMALGAVFWFIPPMTARLLFEDQTLAAALNKPAESAYAVASLKLLPSGLIGLMSVAMFAATMSSLDTGLNRNSAIFVRDIYPLGCRLLRVQPAGGRVQMLMAQAFTIFFGLLIIAIALYFSIRTSMGMFDIMLNLGAMLAIPLAIPLLLGIFVRRVPGWSAIFAIGCCMVVSLAAATAEQTWSFQQKLLANLAVGCAAFMLTRAFWPTTSHAYRRQVAAFFRRMHTPVDFEREVGEANDGDQLKLLGWFLVSAALFVLLLLLLPGRAEGWWAILFIAGSMFAVGLLMLLAARRRARAARGAPFTAAKVSAEAIP